jgi:hypothetical protein
VWQSFLSLSPQGDAFPNVAAGRRFSQCRRRATLFPNVAAGRRFSPMSPQGDAFPNVAAPRNKALD